MELNEQFTSIISTLLQPQHGKGSFSIFDPTRQFDEKRTDEAGVAQAMNAAFLILLAGNAHPAAERAKNYLSRMADTSQWAAEVATFYLNGIDLIHQEIKTLGKNDAGFKDRLGILSKWLLCKENHYNHDKPEEKIWSVFFPEGVGVRSNKTERIESLRKKRMVRITELNACPITDTARQVLFTSNVLLSIPPASKSLDDLPLSDYLKGRLSRVIREGQLYWYDHPTPIGIEPEKNEVLYGLRGLDMAVDYERSRGNMASGQKLTCVLSVSVTHQGLKDIAKKYLEEEIARSGGLKNIDVFVFTEADTQQLIHEVLAPAADRYLGCDNAKELLGVFGVDGEYGRHYSFLKAIAAFWNIFIQPEIRATFKIDLDQVFPQNKLVEQSGASTFEHFTTPLWGAKGVDSNGEPVELGMIAGALVNERDIGKSLFTPDVLFPNSALERDEYIFFSQLPQALSTEAEMMTRYTTDQLDGTKACIQRIHVTGGTNGILVESLRRYRPFTPSFFGRAEDQAYILSVIPRPGRRLAYVHKDGLIMRHDKEAFAQEAIQAAYVGKLVGDYVRILQFSTYARVLTNNVAKLKDNVDPFTGCFISQIPITVVHLRFGLKAASFFTAGKNEQGLEFIINGVQRLTRALEFIRGEKSELKEQYEKERLGWNLYYDTLNAMEDALNKEEDFAVQLCKKAARIIDKCFICSGAQ